MLENGFRVIQHCRFKISPVWVLHKRPHVNNISVVNPFSPVCVVFHAWARVWVCQYVGVFVYVCSPSSAQLRYKSLFSWVCVQQGEALTPDRQHTDWKRCSKMSVMSSQPPHSPGTTNNHPVSTSFSPCCTRCGFSSLYTEDICIKRGPREKQVYNELKHHECSGKVNNVHYLVTGIYSMLSEQLVLEVNVLDAGESSNWMKPE